MTGSIEINNTGETIRIVVYDSTTASDVVGMITDVWPGCAKLIEKAAASTDTALDDVAYSIERLSRKMPEIDCQKGIAGLQSISNQIKEQKRKQKAIDRIAWEAERQQRYQKGGHFE